MFIEKITKTKTDPGGVEQNEEIIINENCDNKI